MWLAIKGLWLLTGLLPWLAALTLITVLADRLAVERLGRTELEKKLMYSLDLHDAVARQTSINLQDYNELKREFEQLHYTCALMRPEVCPPGDWDYAEDAGHVDDDACMQDRV
jgi:hypothetical protein